MPHIEAREKRKIDVRRARNFVLALVVMAVCTAAGPIRAPAWTSYTNARFGYAIAVPPNLVGQPETDNGAARVFRAANGQLELELEGANSGAAGFPGAVQDAIAAERRRAWIVNYQTFTPDWAEFTATKGQRVRSERLIAGCHGAVYAHFTLQYRATRIDAMAPVIARLRASFRQRYCPDRVTQP